MNTILQTVSDYIASCPKSVQPLLRELRRIIKSTAPKAEEKLSYGMPYYSDHGRLVYFGGWKKHAALYVMIHSQQHLPKTLQKFRTTRATLQFPIGTKLPVAAIRKMIKAQMRKNAMVTKQT